MQGFWWSGTTGAGAAPAKEKPAPREVLIEDLYAAVERDYMIRKKRSVRNVRGSWANHLKAHFGSQTVVPYKPSRVEAYIVARQSDGAANATVNRELAVLKHGAALAKKNIELEIEDEKLIVALTRWHEIPLLDESDNVREQMFPNELYDSFAVETAREGLWFRAMFELAYGRGWRPKSMRELKVANVDLARRTIRLSAKQTKNKKPCEIAMTDKEYELLGQSITGKKPNEYVLTRERDAAGRKSRNDGKIVDYRDAWKRVCQRVGVVPGRDGLIFYDAKRGGITNLIDAGIDLKDAMRTTGHLTESAFRRYQQVSLEKLREVARQIERGQRERQRKLKYQQAELFGLDPGRKPS
jgi:site-specific recombinase XerD